MDAGRYESAVMHYTLALQRDPSLVDVRVDRGACYYALEQYDKAIADFEGGIEREPDHAIAHFNMGITYHSIGEDSLMVAYWKRFLELSPDSELSERVRDAIQEFIGSSEEGS
jgi:tetratricopeptide (TPR) repeat protein